MSVYKRKNGDAWWFRIKWDGKDIRESTRTTNKRAAEQIEAARRVALAKGEAGFHAKQKVPTLKVFIESEFQPYIERQHAKKPRTVAYYLDGIRAVLAFPTLANSQLDAIRQEHITAFVAKLQAEGYEVSTANRKLEVLRRAFKLAMEWERVEKAMPIVRLQPGEKRRERVLTPQEEKAYLAAALGIGNGILTSYTAALEGIRAVLRAEIPLTPRDPFLLRDVTVVLLECALRPEECFRLRWDELSNGTLRIAHGKTANARRVIPLADRAAAVLETRRAAFDSSEWVFPAPTKSGHIEGSSIKKQHARACADSEVPYFQIYTIRHTCLTRWAAHMDPYTLAYLAGHSDFSTTRRYVHPQAEQVLAAMERAQDARTGYKSGHSAETDSLANRHDLPALN